MNKITDEHNLLESNKSYKVLIEGPKPELRIPSLTISSLKKRRKNILIIFLIIFFALSLTIGSVLRWYFVNLEPVDPNSNEAIILEIKYGETQREIAQSLEDAGVIKNSFIFNLYTQVTNTKNELKAGVYKLFKHDSLQNTVDKLVSGKGTEISITFLPGASLIKSKNYMSNIYALIKSGFTESEINEAINSNYDYSLLKIKPAGNDIEGFIYGDTYNFSSESTVKQIFLRAFQELQTVIDEYDLVTKFQKQGLSLYEGIILASIVQSEVIQPVGSVPSEDQKIVAGIFYNRLRIGMMLGSDVTYQYIADKLGVPRDISLDNPYNTRRFAGLPPGPISSPGLTALLATAEPKDTDYLFFLSGDDYQMHYSVDDAGHQSNIVQFCSKNCSTL